MYIYNITCKIDENILMQYSKWLNDVHLPEVMATNCFTSYNKFSILDEYCNQISDTVIIQYHFNSLHQYYTYINEFSKELKTKSIELWGDKVLIFRTLLQQVD